MIVEREGMTGDPGTVPAPVERDGWYRIAGAALVIGGVATIALNAIFPRAEDPADVVAVLTTMAEHDVRQKVSFIGGTLGLWVLAGGIAGVQRILSSGAGAAWARLGFYAVLAGVTLFTVATGLGLAATHAAVEWVAAGSGTDGAAYAIAAGASAADDAVWAMSLIALWLGLGLTGVGMVRDGGFPRWLALPLPVIGFATAAFAGIPMAYAGVSLTPMMVFAGLAMLTSVWAVAAGAWMLRRGS